MPKPCTKKAEQCSAFFVLHRVYERFIVLRMFVLYGRKDEVLPLAAYGQFLSGEFRDVHIVTKGGSQGDETAIVRCLSFLKEMVTNEEKEGDL